MRGRFAVDPFGIELWKFYEKFNECLRNTVGGEKNMNFIEDASNLLLLIRTVSKSFCIDG